MSDKQQNSGQSPTDATTLRKQAKDQARTMEPISLSTQTPEEIQRMFHELRVRQVELEMQNEELRTAQAQIDAERARYFDLYDEAPVGYCILSEQGVILEANLTAATLLGTTRTELVTQPFSRFIHNDDQDIYDLHRKQLLETNTLQKGDLRLVKPDGGYIWAHLQGTVDQADDGAPLCRVVISDITERKLADKALSESEALFRGMFNDHSAVMLLIDPKTGQIVEANQAAAHYYGYSLENMIQMKIQQVNILSPADIADKISSAFNRQVNTFEFRHVLANGQVRDVQVYSTPITIQNQILLFSIIQDITDRKRVEESLRQSLARYDELTANVPVGVYIFWFRANGHFEFEYVSNRWCEIHQLNREDVLTDVTRVNNQVHPDDRDDFLVRNQESFRDQIPFVWEGRFYIGDGKLRWLRIESTPIVHNNGDIRWFGMTLDITERKQTEEALRASEAKVKSIIEGVPILQFVIDRDHRVIFWNSAIEDYSGISASDIIDTDNHWSAFYPEKRPVLADLLVDGKIEQIYQRYDGKIRQSRYLKGAYEATDFFPFMGDSGAWLTFTAAPIRDSQGNVIGAVETLEDITERKRAEEAHRHSNELMQYIIEHTNSAVAVHDRDLRYLYVSDRYLKDYGVQEQDIIGKHHYDVFPDLPEKWREIHRKALAGEISSSERDPYERADGTIEWTRWECRPWYEANGAIDGIIVYTEVITERVQAEVALRESEHRHRILFKEALNPILLVDENGYYIDANEAALQFMECDRERLMGRSVWEFAPPAIIERQKREHSPFAERRTLETDYLIHGRVKTLLLNVVSLEAGERTVLCGIGQDITERKQVEASLLRQQRSIKLSSRIANVFLTSPRNEVFADVLDVILKALNSRFGYFGYIDDAGDLVCPSLTRDVWEQCRVPEKSVVFSRSSWGGLWGRSLMEKQTLVANENLQIPEGHVPLENALAIPIVYDDKLIGQFVVANKAGGYDKHDRDLLESTAAQTAPILFAIQEEARQKTAHEKLEKQLRQAQKMETVGRLAGGVAHDFNNMLGVILGYSEMALEQVSPGQPMYKALHGIQQAAQRSADLTRQLLAFARKQTIAPKQIDLNETVKGMLKMLRRLIGEDIDLIWLPGRHLHPVKMDPTQIDQILANLCVNARDAIEGVGKVTIETGVASFDEAWCTVHTGVVPGEYVLLAVSDNGCGMDRETISHLFEPFFTTKEQGKGTGLGLASVYGAVKQNNGFINVYSEPGQGTTFKVYLPQYAITTEAPSIQGTAKPAARGHETILLVEDEQTILEMTTMMLERQGHTVLAAATPNEAIRLAEAHSGRIDLLITDVVMPEMNGRDLARNILSLYPDMKYLFMSGYTANVIAHHGVLEEGVHFIQKPFSKNDLTVKVRVVLDRD